MPNRIPTAHDLHLFHEGNLHHSYRMLGAHPAQEDGVTGVRFTVWAPHAKEVGISGDFNGWTADRHLMEPLL
ncbi:MAG: 1,4-alpha-glucan branching protein, partial [Paenibacillaceae bacterium]|nr:1,4-alpha-glucan branching protein [Paenibacillaceae bacterium]